MKILLTRQVAHLFSAAALAATSTSFAAEVFWNNTEPGSFLDGANWDTGTAPDVADNAFIFNGGTATITTGDTARVSRLLIDDGHVIQDGGSVETTPFGNFESPGAFAIGSVGGLSGSYTITGGSTLTGGRVRIGYTGGNGSLSIGGTSSYNGASNQDTWVGNGSGSVGSFTMTDSAQWNITNDWFVVGRSGGQGTVTITGSENPGDPQPKLSITGGGNFVFGDGAGSSATVNISGGAQIFTTGGEIWVGNAGSTGELNLGGSATMVAQDHWVAIGRRGGTDGSNGTATISGTAQLRKEGASADRHFAIADGAASEGTLIVKDSALVSTNQRMDIGRNGGTGTLTVQGNATVNIGGQLWVGDTDHAVASHGTINLEGGTINVNDWVAVGRRGSGSGTLNIKDGTFNKNGGGNFILNGATATLTQTGGALNVNSGQTWLSEDPGKNSTWTATGGTANLGTETRIGMGSTATMTIGGTANYTNQNVIVGSGANGNGTLNLNGGTFTANSIAKGSGTAAVNFNGGVVRAGTENLNYFANFDSANLNIQAGGLKFDTNGHTIMIAQILGGEGGLLKLGAGQLTLIEGAYLGNTSIAGGKLTIMTDFLADDSNVFMEGDAIFDLDFDGTDTIGALFVNGTPLAIGTWGSSDSDADNTNDLLFSGTGVLNVTSVVPEPGSAALLAAGLGIAVWRLRRRR